MKKSLLLYASLITAIVISAPVMAQTSTVRLRGVIEAYDGSHLRVKTPQGEHVDITLATPFAVSAVEPRMISDIKKGDFIGAGARPQADGSLKALQIVIFPEAQRGTGEGHREWGVLPETTMTNATVADNVAAVNGAEIMLKYKDGEKKISLSADAHILTLVPAQPSDVAVGVEMVTTASRGSDGQLSTARITIGKNGVAPPL
jgi:hypothetical protein